MNILLANNRFFISGGPERYLLSLMQLMEEKGHRVIPFSNAYKQNLPTPYADYFLPPPVDEDSIYFRDFKLSNLNKLQLLGRATYSIEAKERVKRLIVEYDIDIGYFLHISNYISPSIIDACKESGVPVVMRLSDFNLLCPAYLFFRNNRVCEECLDFGLYRAIYHRCLQDSFLVSLARVISMSYHRMRHIYDKVDAFVCPSWFLLEKMVAAGFKQDRLFHIPSPVRLPEENAENSRGDYILYFGRISPEKGLETLLRGFEILLHSHPEARLLIAGSLNPEVERLRSVIGERKINQVEFTGFLDQQKLSKVVSDARFTVCPSVWYENTPMSVYESLAHGRAVVASDIGSLREQIVDNVDGLLFEPGNPVDLSDKMAYLWAKPEIALNMGLAGRQRIKEQNSPETHYQKLMSVFESTF